MVSMSITFIAYIVLWLFGFIFLFHIPLCSNRKVKVISRPVVSIIIPARNEEITLAKLLNSLKGQIDAGDEVIVIDDHSEDKTGKIAEQNGAVVIRSKALPRGWLGKSWACYQGASAATGELLIFLDADTVLDNNSLNKIISTYYRFDGILTIQPYHKISKPYEELSAFFNLVMMAAMGAFTIFRRTIKPLGLFGPVIVLTRQQYIESGGHAKVKGKILEDLEFGAEFKKRGVGIYCYGGKNTVSFRMYPDGVRQLVTGWSKVFAMGAVKTPIPLLIMIFAWITGAIGTTRYFAQAIIIADTNQIIIWGILYICYVFQIYWMLARIGNFKFYTALLYPIPLLFFVILFIYSLVLVFIRKRVQWKGRTIYVKGSRHNIVTPYNTNNDRG